MSKAQVSVVIPVYNGERYLEQAVQSVRAQTHQPREIIVVDDGSTDGSAALAEKLGVTCLRNSHAGAGAARNAGVQRASGKFLAFLDADDLWTPDKTERQLAVLCGASGAAMVFGFVQQFREAAPDEILPAEPGYCAGTMLIRREHFLRVGDFSTEWKIGEFIDWYARAYELGLRSAMITDVLLKRRVHDTNIGIREKASQTDYARVLKAALDRRRGAAGAQ